MTHITPAQLDRIQKLLEELPNCRLVLGCEGIVTCDGMAIEYGDGEHIRGVVHPLSFLDMVDGPELEPLDILK